ncbi:hypothetical protein FGRMN_9392 [Fusarium graminum]|nr:hypothetical protein FGRMN_9392 [Fusarium graminum]
MKFSTSILALVAIATGVMASPHGAPLPPSPPKPPKAPKPPTSNKQTCNNGQTAFCCATSEKNSDVACVPISVGGIGGICNGIQICCQNNSGKQGCSFNTGSGTITFNTGGASGPGPL